MLHVTCYILRTVVSIICNILALRISYYIFSIIGAAYLFSPQTCCDFESGLQQTITYYLAPGVNYGNFSHTNLGYIFFGAPCINWLRMTSISLAVETIIFLVPSFLSYED